MIKQLIMLIPATIIAFLGSLYMFFISTTEIQHLLTFTYFLTSILSAFLLFRWKYKTVGIIYTTIALFSLAFSIYMIYKTSTFLLAFLIFPSLSIFSILKRNPALYILLVILTFLATPIALSNYYVLLMLWGSYFLATGILSIVSIPVKPFSSKFFKIQVNPQPIPQQITKQKGKIVFNLDREVNTEIEIDNLSYTLKGKTFIYTTDKPVRWKIKAIKLKGKALIPSPSEGIAYPNQRVLITFKEISIANWDPNLWVGKTLYNYKVLNVVGTGGNGYVLKGELNKKPYAIKIPKFSPSQSTISLSFSDLTSEAFNLINLSNNENLVRLYAIIADLNMLKLIESGDVEAYLNSPPMIVMEFMEGGSFMDLIQNPQITNSVFWRKIVYKVILQTASGLKYMHSLGYVHLDVKPQNIFFPQKMGNTGESVYKSLKVKLGDLGSAVKIGGKINQITPEYAPPDQLENLINGKGADPKMDIFALGVTTYVALTGKNNRPDLQTFTSAVDEYINGNVGNAVRLLNQAKILLSSDWVNLNVEGEVSQLITRMLDINPQNRPSVDEIITILSKYV